MKMYRYYALICGVYLLSFAHVAWAMDRNSRNKSSDWHTLQGLSQAQIDSLKGYILSQQRISKKPVTPLLQEKILEKMGGQFAPVTEEMVEWLKITTIIERDVDYIVMSPNGRYLCVLYKEINNQKRAEVLDVVNSFTPLMTFSDANVSQVKFSPDGRYFVVFYANNTVRLYDESLVEIKQALLSDVDNIQFSPHSEYFIIKYKHTYATIFNGNDFSRIKTLANVKRVHFSPDGMYILIVYDNDVVRFLDVTNFSLMDNLILDNVFTTVFSSDGKYLAVLYKDGTAQLIRVASRSLDEVEGLDLNNVWNIEFSPDSMYMKIVSLYMGNKTVQVRRLSDLSVIDDEQLREIVDIQFSPMNKYVVVKDRNKISKLLYSKDFSPVKDGVLAEVHSMLFSHHDQLLFIVDVHGALSMYIPGLTDMLKKLHGNELALIAKIYTKKDSTSFFVPNKKEKEAYATLPLALQIRLHRKLLFDAPSLSDVEKMYEIPNVEYVIDEPLPPVNTLEIIEQEGKKRLSPDDVTGLELPPGKKRIVGRK